MPKSDDFLNPRLAGLVLCRFLLSGHLGLHKLGGNFGPDKKYLAPPPPNFLQTPSRPPRPPPLLGDPPPPPPGIFKKKPTSPLRVAPETPPSPSPSRKNEKYPKRPPSKLIHVRVFPGKTLPENTALFSTELTRFSAKNYGKTWEKKNLKAK